MLTMPLMGCGFGCSLSSAVIDEQSNVLASTYTTNERLSINEQITEAERLVAKWEPDPSACAAESISSETTASKT